MAESDDNTKEAKKKTSKLTVTSLVCLVIVVVYWFVAGFVDFEPLAIIAGVFLMITLVSGIAALVRIKSSKNLLTGEWYAIAGIFISLFLIIFLWIGSRPRSIAYRMPCGTNLSNIGRAMLIYAQDHNGRYPEPSQWCDLLLKSGEITEKQLKCSANKNKNVRCTYAMNPNCEFNSPPDTVLVFETEGGWNQFGGFELLTINNHNGNGCNILHNDAHVSFENVTPITASTSLNWGKENE